MNENPITSPSAPPESPVPDPNLFLLHDLNRAYLAGKTTRPPLPKSPSDGGWQFIVIGSLVYIFLAVCGGFDAIVSWLPDIRLPDLPDLPTPTLSAMFLFLLILLVMGVSVVIRDVREAREAKKKRVHESAATTTETPVVVAPPRPKGQVLDGVVVQAEKIVARSGYGTEEKTGVRYQFAAPGV